MKKSWFSPAKALMLGTAMTGSVLFSSCDKKDDKVNNMYTVSGTASGSQVVPPVTVTGTSTISGTYNKETNVLDYNVSWSGLTGDASSVGFYKGASDSVGTSVQDLTITTPGVSGTATGNITLTDAEETDLINGNWYYSITTPTNASGELRGKISLTQ